MYYVAFYIQTWQRKKTFFEKKNPLKIVSVLRRRRAGLTISYLNYVIDLLNVLKPLQCVSFLYPSVSYFAHTCKITRKTLEKAVFRF